MQIENTKKDHFFKKHFCIIKNKKEELTVLLINKIIKKTFKCY